MLAAKSVASYGEAPFMVLFLLGGLGPTISSYLSFWVLQDKDGLREYHTCLFRWRLSIFWYVVPFVISFGVPLIADGAFRLFTNSSGAVQNIKSWFMVFTLFATMVFGGGLEELGWRGIALPELEKRYSPLPSSIVLGLVWVIWHVPLFFIKGVSQYGNNVFVFALGVLGLTFILSWIYNQTDSIFICIIFHSSFNTAAAMGFGSILVKSDEMIKGMATSLLLIIVGLLLLTFSKGKGSNRRIDAIPPLRF